MMATFSGIMIPITNDGFHGFQRVHRVLEVQFRRVRRVQEFMVLGSQVRFRTSNPAELEPQNSNPVTRELNLRTWNPVEPRGT